MSKENKIIQSKIVKAMTVLKSISEQALTRKEINKVEKTYSDLSKLGIIVSNERGQ